MRNLLLSIVSLSLVGAIGCSEMQAVTPEQALSRVNQGKGTGTADVPSCQIDYEEYELDANLLAFEIYSKKGIEFGFNLLDGILKALGLSFKTEKGLMTMSMGLSETIDPTNRVAYVMGNATAKKKNFRFTIDVWQIGTSIDYFKQTPMATLSGNTVKNALSNLQAEVDLNEVRWKTRVVHANEDDDVFVIPVGGVSGLKPGDRFNVYNINYIWNDQPCESELLLPQPTTSEPLIVGEAIRVENNATLLRIVEKNYDVPLELGAMVEVNRLPGDNRYLKRPVRVRTVQSELIPIVGHGDLDLTIYLNEQIRAFMDQYGFHPRN